MYTRTILVPYPFHTQDSPGAEQDSPSPEATTNPSKQQTAGETVKPGAKQDSPGAVPYLSICAGMEQAFVPYYVTLLVPYPSEGMAQASVPYYGTSAVPYPVP